MSDEEIERLLEKMKRLKVAPRIISISYPLSDYDQEGRFQVQKSFPVTFPWGVTEAFLQTLIEAKD